MGEKGGGQVADRAGFKIPVQQSKRQHQPTGGRKCLTERLAQVTGSRPEDPRPVSGRRIVSVPHGHGELINSARVRAREKALSTGNGEISRPPAG